MTKRASTTAALLLLGMTCCLHVATAQPTPSEGGQKAAARTFDEDINFSELEGQPLIEYRQTTEPVDQEIQIEVPEILVNFVTAVNDILIPRVPEVLAVKVVQAYILGLLIFGIIYSFYMLVLPTVYIPPDRVTEMDDEDEGEEEEEIEEDPGTGFNESNDNADDADTQIRDEEGDYGGEDYGGEDYGGPDYGEDYGAGQDEANLERKDKEAGPYLGYTHYQGELSRPDQMDLVDSFWTSRSRVTAPFMHRLIRSIDAFETTMSSKPEPSCIPQMVCETRQLMTYVPSFESIIQTYGLSMNGLGSDYRMALENGAARQSCRAGQPLCTPSFVTWLLEAAKAIDRLWPIQSDDSLDFETEDEVEAPPEEPITETVKME